MDNREQALNNERSEMLDRIFSSERSLYTFVERMAKNEKFKTEKPNTHKFFASLHSFRSVRGLLTDNQKVAIGKEIRKNADYFLTLRVMKVQTISTPTAEPTIHPAGDEIPVDESQALVEDGALGE